MMMMMMMSGGVDRWRGVRARMSGGVGLAPAATRARAHESTGLSSAKIHHDEEEMTASSICIRCPAKLKQENKKGEQQRAEEEARGSLWRSDGEESRR